MDKLFIPLKKKIIDAYDRQLASDYISYYGIDKSEYNEYADEFVAVCYKYNEETGEHEPRDADELPFADVEYPSEHCIKYTYGGQSITRFYYGTK